MSSVIKTKFILCSIFLLSLFSCFYPIAIHAETNLDIVNPLEVNGNWIGDYANIISDRTETKLNQNITKLETTNGTEIVILTVAKTPATISTKEVTGSLLNTWQIGKPQQDNGILFLVSLENRQVEIATGLTIKTIISEAEIDELLRSLVIPAFQRQDFDRGIFDATSQLIARLETIEYVLPENKPKNIKPLSLVKDIIPAIILGIFGTCYYYYLARGVAIFTIENTDYINNRSQNLLAYSLIYGLLYTGCLFISNLVLLPLSAIIFPALFILISLILHFYWIDSMRKNEPKAMNYIILIMVASPIVFAFFSLKTLCTFLVFPFTLIGFKIAGDRDKEDIKNYSLRQFYKYLLLSAIAIISWLLLLTAVNFIVSYSLRKGSMLAFLAFETSIPLVYLVWQDFKTKFHLKKIWSFNR